MTNLDNSYVDWKSWDPAEFGRFEASDGIYYSAETGIDQALGAKVLEIGFGNGAFLGWAKSVGAQVYGIETNPLLNDRARQLLGADNVFDDLGGSDVKRLNGSITHVVAFDVIEHVPMAELSGMLALTRDLLTDTGRMVLRFPNGDSPFGRITQHGDPTHVSTLGYQRLEFFARGCGLHVVEIRAPKLPARGVGLARGLKRCALKAARSLIERVVAQLYFGGRRIALDPNYVAVLARSQPRDVMSV